MVSPHLQALYDRMKQSKNFDGDNVMADSPSLMKKKEKEEDKEGTDLAPEDSPEETSDLPESLHGGDMGQHDLHAMTGKPDPKAHAGSPAIPSEGELHTDNKASHYVKVPVHAIEPIGNALSGLHYKSHPGSLGEKVASSVNAAKAQKSKRMI